MGSYPDEFPFGIMEVVNLLNLRIRRQQANSVYVDCPFCGDRRGRMNVNFVKNVWRCNYCDAHGGMLALYAELNHTTTSDAYWEIAEALCDNIQEEHARSGNEAQQRPASPSPSTSGAWAAPAGHSSSERKQYHSRIRPVQRRSTRRYPCCLLNLRCGRHIGNICAPLNAGCLMNRLTHWDLRAPHRLFYAGLLQNG